MSDLLGLWAYVLGSDAFVTVSFLVLGLWMVLSDRSDVGGD
jgi:uncharacterized membrane protein